MWWVNKGLPGLCRGKLNTTHPNEEAQGEQQIAVRGRREGGGQGTVEEKTGHQHPLVAIVAEERRREQGA